jgi:hypothetical protein
MYAFTILFKTFGLLIYPVKITIGAKMNQITDVLAD